MAIQGGRRAGTLTAVGSVTAVAVLVAAALFGWIRFSAPTAAESSPTALVEELPGEFAGGFVPAPVPESLSEAAGGPVVGVVVLDDPPAGADLCGMERPAGDQELLWAVVTPEGLQVAYLYDAPDWGGDQRDIERGAVVAPAVPVPDHTVPAQAPAPPSDLPVPGTAESPVPVESPVPAESPAASPEAVPPGQERYLEACSARWDPRMQEWLGTSGFGATFWEDQPLPGNLGSGSFCCDDDGFATVGASVTPPEEAAWLLQDRGGYWLAYPTEGLPVVPVTWRYRDTWRGGGRVPSSHVLFVTADGVILDERFVNG